MWVQPFQQNEQQVPARPHQQENRVAVLLNTNARKVNEKVIRSLSHVVPEADLFLSRSELDCRRIAQTVLDRRYQTVFLGGGDGTFTGFVNEILNQVDVRRQHLPSTQAPRFGVLKLGTGNSLAALVKSNGGDGLLDDVLRARAGEVPGYRWVDLLEVEGKRSPFAGLGLDGALLNDYNWVKQNFGKGLLSKVLTGAGGYFSSVAFKTVPYYLTHSTQVECEVVNTAKSAAYLLGPDGLPKGEPIAPGATMFKGPLMMAAAGTIPYYGFELKMFPFAAKRRGMMHLRVGTIPTMKILANLGPLWKGTWFPDGIFDFHAREVTIRFERPMPFQMSGDAEGYREQVTIGIAKEAVEVVDFSGALN